MAGYTKTYTLDFTSSGDTVYTGTDKLEDNIDSIVTWVNDIKKSYAGTSAPTSPVPDEGQIWFDTLGKLFSVYTGGAWSTTPFSGFASGTKMLFYQNTAPTGWTIEDTLDNKLVYVTKGGVAGGQAGGAAHPSGSWTISGLTNANEASHVHSMQSHTHTLTGGSAIWASGLAGYDTSTGGPDQANTGAGSSHTHAISSDGTWIPEAYCCIICSKD